jgi:LacI family transcriptional regulator
MIKKRKTRGVGNDRENGVVTLDMVALEANVSPSTVSRILNGTAQVNEVKRVAVMEAIRQLNFQPNAVARGLAQGKSSTIGVLTQDLGSPFYGEALHGIEDVLAGSGFSPLFVSGHWNLADEVAGISHLLARRVDGIIVLTGRLSDDQLAEYAKRVPIVVTGREASGAGVACLRFDNFRGAVMAVRHLIDYGHTRIAHVAGPPDHSDSIERLQGYKFALEEAGLSYDQNLVVQADYHQPGGLLAMHQLIDSRQTFSAVFASNDQTAFGVRLACYRRGIRVPEDISLVGFDDLPESIFSIPPLTTIKQSISTMGQVAARTLLAAISLGSSPQAAIDMPLPELVVRESTARFGN